MKLLKDISIKEYNTFGLDVKANLFSSIRELSDIELVLKSNIVQGKKFMILGGGSNVLFAQNFNGLILHNELKGIEVVKENKSDVWVKAASGEIWHDLVLYVIEKGWGGFENLSLIPGSVGAGPMQNIGAYGVELKDVFFELEAIDLISFEMRRFNKEDCKFGYRESVFKNELKDKYFITSVTFQLSKNPKLNTTYGAISIELANMGIENPTVKDVSNAVINIRKSKLPDPKILGNSGSFFKNPEIVNSEFDLLKVKFPSIVGYSLSNGKTKLAAGWLIEQCGWKGKQIGNTGSHKNQALVLVNYGGATGNEIYQLALDIKKSVLDKFNVVIEMEVNIIL